MMMGFGFLGMLLLWGIPLTLAVGGAAWIFRQAAGTRPSGEQPQPTAHQILDERFARGEVSAEEYEMIRAQVER